MIVAALRSASLVSTGLVMLGCKLRIDEMNELLVRLRRVWLGARELRVIRRGARRFGSGVQFGQQILGQGLDVRIGEYDGGADAQAEAGLDAAPELHDHQGIQPE